MELEGFANDPKFDKPKEKQANRNKEQYWDRLFAWLFPKDTPLEIRPVAHPQKLPTGNHPYTVHSFRAKVGKDKERILCTESLSTVRRDKIGRAHV